MKTLCFFTLEDSPAVVSCGHTKLVFITMWNTIFLALNVQVILEEHNFPLKMLYKIRFLDIQFNNILKIRLHFIII